VLDGGRELGGIVQAGESWAGAARRTAASVSGDPVPLDLSGEIKRFQIDRDLRVSLRAMTRDDLPDVARWRSSPRVRTWFDTDSEPDLASVTARYGPRIDGMTPTRMWVVEVQGRSVGFCQDYRVRDYPEYAVLTPDPDAVAVDYAIGDDQVTGRGIGCTLDVGTVIG
jgi:aminoglycoside 6'-N-acetyltransferase